MTTPSTGDAMGEERVVGAVANRIAMAMEVSYVRNRPAFDNYARAAIEAYRKAMRDE